MKIRCAKCNAIVERSEFSRDEANRMFRLLVNCHDDNEEMRIYDEDIHAWDAANRDQFNAIMRGEIEGIAFRETPALTSAANLALIPKEPT